ncbi:hypothetical protein NLJ89_g191 [Agrocybe chaxingu]|uniref:Uncharacterized protein n=1 Tax=Agrocybe chaxingu TaxID=84603 RepID=A0A9W8N2F1_9AGAR|nr:hypothetical protein NLJ89_g191 [Agrocybe chaxingu]
MPSRPNTQLQPPPPPPVLNDDPQTPSRRQGDHTSDIRYAAPYNGGQMQSGYGGYGGGYPPNGYGNAGALREKKSLDFSLNQTVQINVQGNGWLLGTVVAVLKTVRALTGTHVKVRYTNNGRSEEDIFENNPSVILPCGSSN